MANLTDSILYLDLAGLLTYDSLIKEVIRQGDAASSDALDAVTGTLAEGDAQTLEEINDELDGIDAALETLNGDATTNGSVAKAVKDGIDAIGSGSAQGTTGQPIVSLTQTNGVVTATAGDIDASHVTVDWGSESPVSATANVQASLNEVYQKLGQTAEAGVVSVYESGAKVNEIKADGKTYTIKQGNVNVATINIAKDMVISGGSTITATAADKAVDDSVVVGEKYIKLTIANSSDVLYIAVKDLYDDYTFTNGTEISFSEVANEVSASLNNGSIAEAKLENALQNKINSARTVVVEKASGHIMVTKTAGTGANADSYTITESDIASDAALTAEVSRAKAAEGEIATLIGLTGAEGSKAYSTNIGGANVVADMNAIDGRLDSAEAFVNNMSAITNAQINGLFA